MADENEWKVQGIFGWDTRTEKPLLYVSIQITFPDESRFDIASQLVSTPTGAWVRTRAKKFEDDQPILFGDVMEAHFPNIAEAESVLREWVDKITLDAKKDSRVNVRWVDLSHANSPIEVFSRLDEAQVSSLFRQQRRVPNG